VVTGDPDKGRRWAREYGFPESSVYDYESIGRMADNRDIDILYSVTPNSLHMRDVLAGFAAGKHCITEKPMALNSEECTRMIEAGRSAGRLLSIGYRLHFHPYYERLKQMAARQGGFNKISGEFSFPWRGPRTWRLEKSMGGGPLLDVGIYVLYAAAMAKQEAAPTEVSARFHPVTRPEYFDSVEQGVDFTLHYADGATCEGSTSWARADNRYSASGGAGSMNLQPAFSYGGLRGEVDGGQLPERDVNQQARQMDAFAKTIMEGGQSIVPGEMGRREMRVAEAIFKAAETGKRVTVEGVEEGIEASRH
jgi:glucose-fructose oxidoreductase